MNSLIIDVYLDKFGYDLRKDEIDIMCEDISQSANEEDEPDSVEFIDPLTDYVEGFGLEKYPKVQRLEKDGCNWITVCGERKAMQCNLPLVAGKIFCKYHNTDKISRKVKRRNKKFSQKN